MPRRKKSEGPISRIRLDVKTAYRLMRWLDDHRAQIESGTLTEATELAKQEFPMVNELLIKRRLQELDICLLPQPRKRSKSDWNLQSDPIGSLLIQLCCKMSLQLQGLCEHLGERTDDGIHQLRSELYQIINQTKNGG